MRKDVDYKLLNNPAARRPANHSHHVTNHSDQINLNLDTAFMANTESTPKTADEALASDEWNEWARAMEEELGMMEKMGTWRLEALPSGRNAVGSKWVFLEKG